MATKGLYRGYSSFEFERVKSFRIDDVELINLDLLNHIYTRRGTRVMMPTFGTIIPDLVFEPLDADTLEDLDGELRYVFEYDPRVEALSLSITPDYDTNSVTVSAVLLYVELNMTGNFNLNLQFEE